MLEIQFDIKRINKLKEICICLRNDVAHEMILADFRLYFEDVTFAELLLLELELVNGEYGITVEDLQQLAMIHQEIYERDEMKGVQSYQDASHPVQVFQEENSAIQFVMTEIGLLLASVETDRDLLYEPVMVDELQRHIICLGQFHHHFNRKEKLFFPILERYGHYAMTTRSVWRKDDRIRAFYKALKGIGQKLPEVDVDILQKAFATFEAEMDEMMYQEENLILPLLTSVFREEDWRAVSYESDAFGYTIIKAPEKKLQSTVEHDDQQLEDSGELVHGGGGYLTTEEARHILNNLPLEITFVDKTAMFKYFNDITKDASEMMLVRTPSSIGRNVANCHPPKSLKKVMTVIRNLKTGKQQSESMWFKKGDHYIHITYKAIFNDEGEFLGILEYVQDMQPFFELPFEVKMSLSQ